ncbi:hypothetical protein RHIZO_01646 [Rhizobiaceae bacterium]|nr:hypothetical protein RHIZO_01646 [Rhizobiaceae bacterium]
MALSVAADMSRRRLIQALLATTAIPLLAALPKDADPNAIVEVGGWILKRGDLR